MRTFIYQISKIAIVVIFFALISGCSKKNDSDGIKPVVNDSIHNGRLCIENRLDSTMLVNIIETNQQFTIIKDYLHCSELKGNKTYHINYHSPQLSGDTALYLNPDASILIILR